ncbi:MAG TPA: hypothetical protein VFO85_03730, partial [Vicinamibacteria bacterium]|nr:hypothetical protein [Vicinamibacteria bacterium]
INSAQDRTILFDLLPLKAAGFRGFELRLELAAVPGQAMYAATRRLVLKGADSVVFVANSAADRWDENVQSFREMADNLIAHQLDPASLPLVVQYNKRDLPEVTPIDFMERALNARKIPSFPAVAVRGEGVLETFAAVLKATMEDLAVRYQVVDLGRGQPLQKWVNQAVLDMFGATTLAPSADGEGQPPAVFTPAGGEAPPDRRSVRIDLPEDALRMASRGPSARANESLVDSYADVTARLTSEMTELRDQHNRLRRWLEQLQSLAVAAQGLTAGQPREPTLRMALEPLAEAAGSRSASLLVPVEGALPRALVVRGQAEDPLLRLRSGQRELERMLHDGDPRLHHAADSLDLGEALQDPPAGFASVAAVPLRTAAGLHALALLYFTPDDVLPTNAELQQLRALSAVLAPALELAARQDRSRDGEAAGDLPLVGLLARLGMDQVVSALVRLREAVADVRRDPALSTAALTGLGRVAPSLAEALGAARAMAGFARGDPPEDEQTDLDDLLADLPDGVELVGPAADATVRGHRALLRAALAAVAQHLRGPGGQGRVQLATDSEGETITLRMAAEGPPQAASETDPSLLLARRILERQGGSLGQESREGRTSTVLTLPRA